MVLELLGSFIRPTVQVLRYLLPPRAVRVSPTGAEPLARMATGPPHAVSPDGSPTGHRPLPHSVHPSMDLQRRLHVSGTHHQLQAELVVQPHPRAARHTQASLVRPVLALSIVPQGRGTRPPALT